MKRLKGKTVLVTGGGSGIGRGLCLYMARKEAVIICVDRDTEAAEACARVITQAGGICRALRGDVTVPGDMERVIRDTTDEYGRLDLIFNNAGISANGEFQDIPMEFWQKIVDVNLMGVVHGCRYAYPVMMRQGSGHIINVASLAGLIPGGPYTPYSATKHAVAGFSLSLRGEAKQHGIKVTALCPGYLRTNIQNTTPNFSTYMETENSGGLSRKFPAPDKFIPAMVRGVMRNRAVVIAPGAQRVFWWLHRLAPGLIPKLTCRMIGYMKKKQRPA